MVGLLSRGRSALARVAGDAVLAPAVTFVLSAAGYLGFAQLGYQLENASSGLASFWPSAGLIVGLLVRLPRRLRGWCAAAVLPSEVAIDSIHGAPLAAGLGWAAVDFTEVVIAAVVLVLLARRLPRGDVSRDFFALASAAFTVTALTGLAGGAVSHATFGGPFFSAWLTWWLGDATGILLVVPLVLAVSRPGGSMRGWQRVLGLVEVAVVIGVVVAVFALTRADVVFLVLPPLVLLAINAGLLLTAIASVGYAAVAAILTGAGHGPMATIASTNTRVLALDAFIAATAFVAFLICASIAERRQAEQTADHLATHDPLTGLPNRRQLVDDLAAALAHADPAAPQTLALFDLDGFKAYNDTFGHLAGDQLLARLGDRVRDRTAPHGQTYRLGGDEFCLLLHRHSESPARIVADAAQALSETGSGFSVGCSAGAVIIPTEAADISAALHIADTRMYDQKRSGRAATIISQTRDVLLRATAEHAPELPEHMVEVGQLAREVGRRLGLDPEALELTMRVGELHDVGKIAIPQSILDKPGPLSDEEWSFIGKHTLIGESILNAAPALQPVAKLVRSTHERFDGKGYPDGLAGEAIPLPSRIVFACDTLSAMLSPRPYSAPMTLAQARAELTRCAGTQFDPSVVSALLCELDEHGLMPQEHDDETRETSERAA